jgi:hypothetical protein
MDDIELDDQESTGVAGPVRRRQRNERRAAQRARVRRRIAFALIIVGGGLVAFALINPFAKDATPAPASVMGIQQERSTTTVVDTSLETTTTEAPVAAVVPETPAPTPPTQAVVTTTAKPTAKGKNAPKPRITTIPATTDAPLPTFATKPGA